MRDLVPCCALAATLLACPSEIQAQPTPPPCIPGSEQSFAFTGGFQTYDVPANTTALLITANGGSGGKGYEDIAGSTLPSNGAHLLVGIPVNGLGLVSVVVGGAGTDSETVGGGGAGGGGGSFVFTGGTLLVAAGAGGGGMFPNAGHTAQLTESGSNGGVFGIGGGAGGSNGLGGGGGVPYSQGGGGGAGGGGGFLGVGGGGTGSSPGLGGHQVGPPGDAAGGAAGFNGAAGAFGGGGGGAYSGGGGGGYSGGGGGGGDASQFSPGGGGGSFVAAGGTIFEASGITGNGSVTICATAIAATTSLTSQASPSVEVGGAIRDQATLAGGASPGGTITFDLFGPADPTCAGPPLATSSPPVAGNGNYDSASFVTALAGTYRWVVTYSGDANNLAAGPTACGEATETVVVTALPSVVSVPTLGRRQLALLVLLLAGIGVLGLRRLSAGTPPR